MKELDGHNKEVHVGTEIVAKKKLESKFLGAGRRPFKNAILYALDKDTYEIYEVKIEAKKVIKVKSLDKQEANKEAATSKAFLNPEHPTVWAMNKQNALRKFLKLKFKV